MITGVYKIENTQIKRIYIGESFDIENRWKQHRNELMNNSHINSKLQNDFNSFGKENFKFDIIQEYKIENAKPLITQAHLIMLEDSWVKHYKYNDYDLYNIEDTLREALMRKKVLQVAPDIATNVLLMQLSKYKMSYHENSFVFEEYITIKNFLKTNYRIGNDKIDCLIKNIKLHMYNGIDYIDHNVSYLSKYNKNAD